MQTIIFTVLLVLLFDWGLGTIMKNFKKKQQKRDNDLFIFKLQKILENQNKSVHGRIEEAKSECRNTIGDYASGAYITLDLLEKQI